jgi:inosose dehydratase
VSTTPRLVDRIATAPISWGICEVPGWGIQLPVNRVLAEMAEVGFTHTELGSLGYLPTEPAALRRILDDHNLELLGGFVPVVLHDADRLDAALAGAREAAALLAGGGATFFVTAVVADTDEWHHLELTAAEWKQLCRGLEEIERICADAGLTQVVHPHVDTVVEQVADVEKVLSDTDVSLCLDTAHLAIGGADPLTLARTAGDRIGLVHLKDLDDEVAARLRSKELSLMESVQGGIFPPLGRGSVPITEIVTALELTGRDLWYVLEQDTAITDDNPSALARPKLDVMDSVEFLRGLNVDSSALPRSDEQSLGG